MPIKTTCPYCHEAALLTDSSAVYGGRSYGMIWWCEPCDAYVGTHKNSKRNAPLGRLADSELRYWKKEAHKAFDPLWVAKMNKEDCSKTKARRAGYGWLARQLKIKLSLCHIGMFDVDLCQQTVKVCNGI